MIRVTLRALGVLLLFLCVVGYGWVEPKDVTTTLIALPEWQKREATLHGRQTSDNCANYLGDEDVPECEALCAPSSFSCSSSSLQRRYLESWSELRSDVWNETAALLPRSPGSILAKRVFNVITQDQVATYLPNQYNGNFDPYFGSPMPLVELVPDGRGGMVDTDNTVVVQREFGNQPFAVGSAGLHGCTVVTVVSDRAVYMGHFWEVPGWSRTDLEFNERVINFFKGGTTFGIGPSLNPALFTAADNTRVYIMTPRRKGQGHTVSNYQKKFPKLVNAIRRALGTSVPIATWKYVRLDYKIPAQRRMANTNQRGIAVFQFDPNANGQGTRGWRLFYEEMPFASTDPPPGPDSVKGIPPLPPLPPGAE